MAATMKDGAAALSRGGSWLPMGTPLPVTPLREMQVMQVFAGELPAAKYPHRHPGSRGCVYLATFHRVKNGFPGIFRRPDGGVARREILPPEHLVTTRLSPR